MSASRSGLQCDGTDLLLVRAADVSGAVQLADFSIADFAADLAEEQADRGSVLKGHQPTGGFHKRHLVGAGVSLPPNVRRHWP